MLAVCSVSLTPCLRVGESHKRGHKSWYCKDSLHHNSVITLTTISTLGVMCHPGFALHEEAEQLKLKVYNLARTEAETHTVTSSGGPRTFDGMATTQSSALTGSIQYCRNVTLQNEGGQVLLQRFGPTSWGAESRMMDEAAKGKKLLDAVYAKASSSPSDCVRGEKTYCLHARYDFGACYRGVMPDWTYQTAQDYNDRSLKKNDSARQAVADFCAWFHNYAENFVCPLLQNTAYQSQVDDRARSHFPWLQGRITGLNSICHAFYSTFTPTKGFDDDINKEEDEASPTVLLNFGQHALFDLPQYNCAIELQPLDIVFFAVEEVKFKVVESSRALRAGRNPAERWSVSCCFLKAFEQHLLPGAEPCDGGKVAHGVPTHNQAGRRQRRGGWDSRCDHA